MKTSLTPEEIETLYWIFQVGALVLAFILIVIAIVIIRQADKQDKKYIRDEKELNRLLKSDEM